MPSILILIWGGVSYAGPCANWYASFDLQPSDLGGSRQLSASWSPAPTSCTYGGGSSTYSFDHYEVCIDEGTTAPTSPGSGTCHDVSAPQVELPVHRASRDYAARVFACDDSACSAYFGDGTTGGAGISVVGAFQTTTTEDECFVAKGITSRSDTARVVSESSASASGVLFFPTAWTQGDHMAIYWSEAPEGSERQVIKMKRAQASGWDNFNVEDTDTGTYTSDVVISQSAASGLFRSVTHPWVVAEDDGLSGRIRLYVQAQGDTEDTADTGWTPYDKLGTVSKVYSIPSTDDEGDDFGLTCAPAAGCAEAGHPRLAWHCDTGEACDFTSAVRELGATDTLDTGDDEPMWHSNHGRSTFDYVANPTGVDFSSDAPSMVFTGLGECETAPPDDIYMATWDSAQSEYDVAMESGTPVCADVVADGHHDPGVIPLPGGAFKMYVKKQHEKFVIYYFDGTDWEAETAEVNFCLDHDTADPCSDVSTYCADPKLTTGRQFDERCLENIDAVLFADGTSASAGVFTAVSDDIAIEECDLSMAHKGILFWELGN